MLFDGLPGAWTLRREIDDARFGAGTFEGRATFTAQANGSLLYEERGELQLGAWRGPAGRRWIYVLEDDAIIVRHPGPGLELHSFRFTNPDTAHHVHLCDPDRYSARLRRLPDGAFSLAYEVSGPAKDYRLRTQSTRES